MGDGHPPRASLGLAQLEFEEPAEAPPLGMHVCWKSMLHARLRAGGLPCGPRPQPPDPGCSLTY